jgi:hypothetical protein
VTNQGIGGTRRFIDGTVSEQVSTNFEPSLRQLNAVLRFGDQRLARGIGWMSHEMQKKRLRDSASVSLTRGDVANRFRAGHDHEGRTG